MRQERRSFCRETPEQRREDLISATLEVISAGGAKAASVRNIAAQANVTMGLIRHYFCSKEDLINAAYEVYLTRIIDLAMSPDQLIELPARVRLRKLIEANFTEPVLLPQSMTLWVAFIEMTGQIPEMARIYARIYTEARSRLERLKGAQDLAPIMTALRAAGVGSWPAVLMAGASGLMEPLGSLFGAGIAGGLALAYPVGLGLAAGAMIFVVSHEVIPETHRNGHQTSATLGLMAGFAVMMFLDTAMG